MKKIFKFIFILLVIPFLFSCERKNKDTIEIVVDNTTISAGEEVYLTIKATRMGNFIFTSSDETVAIVDEFGFLTGLKEGGATITAYLEADPSFRASIDITITKMVINNIKVNGYTFGNVGDVLSPKYVQYPRGMEEALTFSSSDASIASVDKDGKITLKAKGTATITILSESGYTTTFETGAFDFTNLYVSPLGFERKNEETVINIGGIDYYYNYTYLTSLKTALKYAASGATIHLSYGIFDEDVIVSKDNIKISGVTYENKESMAPQDTLTQSTFTASLVVSNDVKGFEISNITFTEGGNITLNGNNDDLIIRNNSFINSSISASWSKINSDALIYFKGTSEYSDGVYILDNEFKNVSATCITLSNILNLKIMGNTFKSFALDAIKSNLYEATNSCQWLIRNNTFTNGGYNAIYMPSFGSKVISYEQVLLIFDNVFENIGISSADIYKNPYGAISLCGFNGGSTSVVVRYNSFKDCASCVRIDNEQEDTYFNNLDVYANYNCIVSPVSNALFESYKKVDSTKYEKISNDNFINALDNVYLDKDENVISASIYCSNKTVKTTITKTEFENENKIYANNIIHLENTPHIAYDGNITFESKNTDILTVSADGSLNPLKTGNAEVVAKKDGNMVSIYHFYVKESLNVDYASLLVKIALAEEGYVEGANNYTKYGVWYSGEVSDNSFAHGAWCAMFVSWCANQANIPRTIIPLYASCAAGRQWFETRGLFKYKESYTPKTGDIIFFLSNGASHTGIVVAYKNGTVYTIEGNTSDMCHQRSYDPNNARITGYGTPNYPVYEGEAAEFDISSATSGEGHSTR